MATRKQAKTVEANVRKDAVSVPSEDTRLAVSIMTTLIDRYEGLSTTELVWARTANNKFVKELLVDERIKDKVAEFFVRRSISVVLKKLIKTVMFKPSETAFTKDEFFNVLSSVVEDVKAAGAINELCLPPLIELGLISDAIQYSKQLRYGFDRVSISDIRNDVTMYNVVEEVKKVSVRIDKQDKVSATVFAEAVAEAMRPVGLAIYEIVDMGGVVDDLVKGVRAHIDPTQSISDMGGVVPHDWRNHKVVAELATNLVFVRAALSLPSGASLALTTDSWKLDKWASIVLTAIKSSERFQWVSKAEALRHYSIRKVRDLRGVPVSAVVARWIEVTPVAQAVFAVEDVGMAGAYNISPTKDRISDAVQKAYGTAKFSLLEGADLLKNNLEDYVQAGWNGASSVYVVDAGGNSASLSDIAVLLADQLYVGVSDGKVEVASHLESVDEEILQTVWDPAWWYSKNTTEQGLRVWSGHHLGDRIITNDPAEVVLASDDRDALDAVPARPQLLSQAAFNTRLLTFSEDVVKRVDSRFSFQATVAGVKIAGSFRAVDFASLRSGTHTCLVMPHYNAEVIRGLESTHKRVAELNEKVAKSSPDTWNANKADPQVMKFIERRQARELLALAQRLDANFRNEVHSTIIERAIASGNVKGSDADLFRAKLGQKSFAAVVDLLALRFFLFIQGIETEYWTELLSSETVASVCMEMGSDRNFF